MPNDKGNTPLHLAAALGSVDICFFIASKSHKLMEKPNRNGETPFFWAARHGKLDAFVCLHNVWKKSKKEEPVELFRRNDGSNILHEAISGEHFEFAYQIILKYEKLVDRKNAEGLSPLCILAQKPSVFRSSSNLGLFHRIFYNFLIVPELKEKDFATEYHKNNSRQKSNGKYPPNYDTCMNLMQKSWSFFNLILGNLIVGQNKKYQGADEENQGENNAERSSAARVPEMEENLEGSIPPNYTACRNIFEFAMNVVLIILDVTGVLKSEKVREKKRKHTWAYQLMNKLTEHEMSYCYDHDGRSPTNLAPEYAARFPTPDLPFEGDESEAEENDIRGEKDDQHEPDAVEKNINEMNISGTSPILVAAKMGITEMVEKIFHSFPFAIKDVDEHGKNALLLAIVNKQTKVYNFLMKKKLPEFVLHQVDDEGNTALHLAARFDEHLSWRIPGAALQLQWEIKWYKHIKQTMPSLPKHNKKGETAWQIFRRTHKTLVKEGSEWLNKTSESCSVVAALIATVAFATSTTVPGGNDNNTGYPVLKGLPAFDIFSIASLLALCFSVVALALFLAILTSRIQEKDFGYDLPRKLLLGLSSLSMSIVSMLVSFCAGHSFVLKDELRSTAIAIYAITCTPIITIFLFAQLPLYYDLLLNFIRTVRPGSSKVFQ